VKQGEGYWQVAERWFKAAKVKPSDSELLALVKALKKANDNNVSLKVGAALKFDPKDPALKPLEDAANKV
jgi:hypothetical protein